MSLNPAVSTACQQSSLAGHTLACETISEGRSVGNLVCNSLELASCPGSHVGTGLAWNDTIHQGVVTPIGAVVTAATGVKKF